MLPRSLRALREKLGPQLRMASHHLWRVGRLRAEFFRSMPGIGEKPGAVSKHDDIPALADDGHLLCEGVGPGAGRLVQHGVDRFQIGAREDVHRGTSHARRIHFEQPHRGRVYGPDAARGIDGHDTGGDAFEDRFDVPPAALHFLILPLEIDGHFAPGARQAEGLDPSHPGKPAYRFALGDRGDVDRALAAALRAQPAWAAFGAERRGSRLEACAVEIGRRRGDLIGAMMVDGAKTVAEADAEVSEAIDFARYYARTLREIADETLDCGMEPLGAGS